MLTSLNAPHPRTPQPIKKHIKHPNVIHLKNNPNQIILRLASNATKSASKPIVNPQNIL